jgi:aspartyl-tRNA(Asn)/glutamyl-tRNA(Gln) amidotransferase subunit C
MAQVSDRYGVDQSKQGSARFGYVMRDDELRPCLTREDAMRNAPETDGVYFRVPKVIEK